MEGKAVTPSRIVVTGAGGLLGRHAAIRLHAMICAARFRGDSPTVELIALDRRDFSDHDVLRQAVGGAHAILHFAGVNRGADDEVEAGNANIAEALRLACEEAGSAPHVVYANSVHAGRDTPYGRGKARAGRILSGVGPYTDLVLPHIFGEGARPFYNNVTATMIAKLLVGEASELAPDGRVGLVHAGAAAQMAIDAALQGRVGRIDPKPHPMSVPNLWNKLTAFHEAYEAGVYPDLADPFDRDLFNAYRAATYPSGWPRPMRLNTDPRGTLFEAVKGGGGGQTFLSTTAPGITRGDHFHLHKVERFLVVQGDAVIRMRPVLGGRIHEYHVSGERPAAVDMPTLWTHSIENVGEGELLTLFWTHDLFDPASPDTYADSVLPQ